MLKQTLAQKLQQKLSPQQIQLMKLVQLPTQSLEARIKQEIEENPALQEGKEKAEDTFENDASDEREVRESMEEINWDDYLGDDDTPDYKPKPTTTAQTTSCMKRRSSLTKVFTTASFRNCAFGT